jgi:aryl-alcohol dehydrogenase-like predicted oxidoreductase
MSVQRPLGNTGITVSGVGFGGWGIGGRTPGSTSYGDTDDGVSLAALRHAIDSGINFIDTAPAYGDGRSEELIGQAIKEFSRDRLVLASKAGVVHWAGEPDYSSEAISGSLEATLQRVQTDYLDLLQLHNAPLDLLRRRPEIIETLIRLQERGKIRAWGLSVKTPADGVDAIEAFSAPVIQANLNMLDTRAVSDGLLKKAVKCGTGIVARTPLCFGFLSGTITPDTRFPEGDHRQNWPREQILHWLNGAETVFGAISDDDGMSQAQNAVRFCLSLSGVSTVLPGILNPQEAEEHARAAAAGPLTCAAVDRILEINNKTDFFLPRADAGSPEP